MHKLQKSWRGSFMPNWVFRFAALTALSVLPVPAVANVPGKEGAAPTIDLFGVPISPVVSESGQVTFRLKAPEAMRVEVRGAFSSPFEVSTIVLSKDASGVWTGSTGPLQPETYSYTFIVDGVSALDPGNAHSRRDGVRVASTFFVPGERSAPYAVSNVPHGTLAQVWYDSPRLKLVRRAYVYTPPGYERGVGRYPVLYLLHGGLGDEDAWTSNGRVPQILDNLINGGKIVPMIVVMPNGNADQTASTDYVQGSEPMTSFFDMAFPDSIVTDLLPFIDRTYRTRPNRDSRAVAGLSMGGAHALWAAFRHGSPFGWVESMSGGYMIIPGAGVAGSIDANANLPDNFRLPTVIDPRKLLAQLPGLTPAAAGKMRLLTFTVGEKDRLLGQQRALQAEFAKRGIKARMLEVPGYSHEWGFWRISLVDMLPRLFRAPRVAGQR
jgi:enterochelin esterase family protein